MVEISSASKTISMGIVVDSVSEVMNIKSGDIEDTPSFGTKLKTEFILGMAKMGSSVKILLDIDLVLADEEVAEIQEKVLA